MTGDRGNNGLTWMERLRGAAGSGQELDLTQGFARDEGHSPRAGKAVTARQLPAEDIRAVLLEPNLVVDPRGLQIRGALVSGTLNLDHAKLPCRLVFTHCRFENAPSFKQAHLSELILNHVMLPSLSLSSTRVAGNCMLALLQASGGVNAKNIRIGGQLRLNGAKLSNSDGDALNLDGADISDAAFLDGLETTGEVRALGSEIGGQLDLTGARLINPGGDALNLDGAKIAGGAFLDGLEASGEVRAFGVRITGQLNLREGKLSKPAGDALSLDGAEITGCAFLDGLNATGAVRAPGARISGSLSLTRAKLTHPDGDALNLDSAEITGGVSLESMEATGAIQAFGARINGSLSLTEAKLTNPNGNALSLDRSEITGGTFLGRLEATGAVRALGARFSQLDLRWARLSNPTGDALSLDVANIALSAVLTGLVATGGVRALSAHIHGQLVLNGAKITNPGGDALSLDGTEIAGDAFLKGLETTGEVRAVGAQIKGLLHVAGAKLTNPGGDALSLDGVKINGDAFLEGLVAFGTVRALGAHLSQLDLTRAKLTNPDGNALHLDRADISSGAILAGLEATGAVRALGANIHGQLDMAQARLTYPDGNALDLSNATLDTIILDDVFTADGRVNLSFVSIRVLSVGAKKSPRGLPLLSGAQGWTIGTVHGFLRTDRNSARTWLDTIDTLPRTGSRKEFAAQPWKELAIIYDQIGQPEDGRRLRFWAARRTTGVAPVVSKLVRWPYAALVGYGYYPAITLAWLSVLWITVLVLCCFNAQAFTPTDLRASTVTVVDDKESKEVRTTGATATPPNYPKFNPALFAAETAVPAAAVGQSAAWRVTENYWLPWVLVVIKGLAWLLAALLLAGVSGLLRKD